MVISTGLPAKPGIKQALSLIPKLTARPEFICFSHEIHIMQSRRLVRLIQTVLKARIQPRQNRDGYLKEFKIKKTQFYRDREALERLGFVFPVSSAGQGVIIKKEPVFNLFGISLGQILALVLSARQQVIAAANDFGLAYSALDAITAIINSLPSKHRKEMTDLVDKLIIREAFGCDKKTLDDLQDAAISRNRILLDYQDDKLGHLQRHTVDLETLNLKDGNLLANAFVVEIQQSKTFLASNIKQLIKTPFLSPGG